MAYITRTQFAEIRNVIPGEFQRIALMPSIQRFYKKLLVTEDAATAWATTKFSSVLSYLQRTKESKKPFVYPMSIRELNTELKEKHYPSWKSKALKDYYRRAIKAHKVFTSLSGYGFDDETDNFPRALAYLEVLSLGNTKTPDELNQKIKTLTQASNKITEASTLKDVYHGDYEALLLIDNEDWV